MASSFPRETSTRYTRANKASTSVSNLFSLSFWNEKLFFNICFNFLSLWSLKHFCVEWFLDVIFTSKQNNCTRHYKHKTFKNHVPQLKISMELVSCIDDSSIPCRKRRSCMWSWKTFWPGDQVQKQLSSSGSTSSPSETEAKSLRCVLQPSYVTTRILSIFVFKSWNVLQALVMLVLGCPTQKVRAGRSTLIFKSLNPACFPVVPYQLPLMSWLRWFHVLTDWTHLI